jgi:perosamine synthetase
VSATPAATGPATGVATPAPPRRVVPFARTTVSREAHEAATRVLSSGWLTTGAETAAFEREFAEHLGAEHAVAVSSCTAGLQLALRALRLRPGASVLTPTLTFCGAVHAIVAAGLRPVLVDSDPDTLLPDAASTAAAATRATRLAGPPAGMIVQHMAGYPAPVGQLAAAAGLPLERVVEDAAHGLGASLAGAPLGTVSALTCFSFYATKNLPAGEGGAVTTGDAGLADRMRRVRLHGMSRDAWNRYLPGGSWRYSVEDEGMKANPTDLTAAIARAQLRHLDGWQRRRHELAARYDAGLAAIPGLLRPPRPRDEAAGTHAWHLYVIRVGDGYGIPRDALVEALAARGVGTSVHFIPIHHHPYFRRLLGEQECRELPGADRVFPQLLSLPMHQGLADEDVDHVCDVLAELRRDATTVGPRARTGPAATTGGSACGT